MVLLTWQNKGIPMTTKLRSCFPPCRFSNSALMSICCLSLPDFLTGVGVEPSSSDVWTEEGGKAGFGVPVSGTLEAMLTSSPGGPLWGTRTLCPFSSEVKLQKDQKICEKAILDAAQLRQRAGCLFVIPYILVSACLPQVCQAGKEKPQKWRLGSLSVY